MASGGLTSQPLRPESGFNWVFQVELLVCGILTVFFLFYFNRLFATLVSYGIRAYTWHTYRAYIDIQALQISLLGGRLFFKDIRYHAHNETILVHHGYITWRYWYRKVKEAEIFSSDSAASSTSRARSANSDGSASRSREKSLDKEEKGGTQSTKDLPCRISIKVSGVEVFLYNRSPAYDAVIENVTRAQNRRQEFQGTAPDRSDPEKVERADTDCFSGEEPQKGSQDCAVTVDGIPAYENDSSDTMKPRNRDRSDRYQKPPIPAFLRMFPIRIECKKAAAVVGNENTPCVITAKVDSARGEFDAGQAGPLDIYKQLFHFDFVNPVVHMKPNTDFKALQLATAARLKKEVQEHVSARDPKKHRLKTLHPRRRAWHALRNLIPLFRTSVDSVRTISSSSDDNHYVSAIQPPVPGQERWQGLSRYLDESQHDEHDEWDNIEYAKSSLIVDCPRVSMTFYWDIPGSVPRERTDEADERRAIKDDINGTLPPEYGLDLQIHGGTVNYGPWADRQRIHFQSFFFPGSYTDAVPAKPLTPGETRVCTVFKLFLSIEAETTLRIPVREASKDWKWKGRAGTVGEPGKRGSQKDKSRVRGRKKSIWRKRDKGATGPTVRPFAWVDVKVFANTTVNYVMDMVARSSGYQNRLDVDIRGSEISSSVNHGLLWRSGGVSLDCDLSFPLGWNKLREWHFNIITHDLDLFLLRDHLFLITDIVADWGSGPPADYYTFTPFRYYLKINFHKFKLYLNTNDSNIINNPSDLDDNNFIVLFGNNLHADLVIPLDRFRPLQNEIAFNVLGRDFGLDISMPSKNTINTFVSPDNVAKLGEVTLKGSHNYFTETSASRTDTLSMDIRGTKLSLYLYGFLVRHFMKIKDNYFGEDLHFKTLEEFQDLPRSGPLEVTMDRNTQPTNRSNDLDVILCISADDATVMMPANLYKADEIIVADLPFANADLRFTNYYMDLVVNFGPLSVSHGRTHIDRDVPINTSGCTQIFVNAADIYGHHLFGLPPTEPTYVCHWDFDVGNIVGECSSGFLEKLAGAIRAFAFSLDDHENAMPIAQPLVIPDITFLRVNAGSVRIWLHVDKEAVLLSSAAAEITFNDWAGSTFSQRLSVLVPDLTVSCVDAKSASRHRTRAGEREVVKTHAYLHTTLALNMLKRKFHFTEERQKQQSHVHEHDQRTQRTPYLMISNRHRPMTPFNQQASIDPPAMIFPPIPFPLITDDDMSRRNSPKSSTLGSGSLRQLDGLDAASLRSESQRWAISRRGRRNSSSRTSSSSGSLSQSIRKSSIPVLRREDKGSVDATLSGSRPKHRVRTAENLEEAQLTDQQREKRGLPPSSVAMLSPLAAPYFPLDTTQPDLADVPPLSGTPRKRQSCDDPLPSFSEASSREFDENLSHMSFVISAEPGIQVVCKPQAVAVVSNILEIIQPKKPEDLLDAFQVDVLSEILDLQKRKEGKGASVELSLRVPIIRIRFLNTFKQTTDRESNMERDQYDLSLDRLAFVARSKTLPSNSPDPNISSLHATVGSAGISVTEKALEDSDDHVAIRARVDDILTWLVSSNTMSVNVSFKGMEIATASKKIDYLASLIHRTTLLGDEFAARFAALQNDQQRRLRYFAYSLTMLGGDIPDPPFLTRPTYALRAAINHLRNHDSWKIISRFRYIYQSLPEETKLDLTNRCAAHFEECPPDAEAHVIESWDQWRTWDLAHVKNSFAMRKLYGSMAGIEKIHPKAPVPLGLTVRSGRIKLIIDPGPRQNEFAVHVLAIVLAVSPPSAPSGLMLMEDGRPKESTIVQVNSRSISLRLGWEICELVEDVVKLFQHGQPLHSRKAVLNPSKSPQASQEMVHHDFQVVLATGECIIDLNSIHLKGHNVTKGLKVSLIGTDRTAVNEGLSMSTLVYTQTASTELQSHARPLWNGKLDAPSLYISLDDQGADKVAPKELKIVGASKRISMEIKEEILGLLEVADAVIRDEVGYLVRQVDRFSKTAGISDSQTPGFDESPLPHVTVALLMDSYQFDVALLQSLTYSVSAKVGRISCVPDLSGKFGLRVDYDLKEQTHILRASSHGKVHTISALDMPPINGRFSLGVADGQSSVNTTTTVEVIRLDASAMHGLLTVVNRPEISEAVHAIQADVKVLSDHVRDVFPARPRSPAVKTAERKPIVYGVRLALAGLYITAVAPGRSPDSATANLVFGLDRTTMNASNASSKENVVLQYPEAHAHIRHINLTLSLAHPKGTRRCGNVTLGLQAHCTSQRNESGASRREYRVRSSGLEVNVFAETASAIVDVMNHLQDRIRDLDLSKERKYLRQLRSARRQASFTHQGPAPRSVDNVSIASSVLFSSTYSLELLNIQISWIVGNSVPAYAGRENEDLVLWFRRIDLSTKTDNGAELMIEDLRLQMTPASHDKRQRSMNSALLPEVIFNVAYVSTDDDFKLAFQAAGKSLDLHLESHFILPANILERSITLAAAMFRDASANWQKTPTPSGVDRKNLFGNKRLSSLVVDADFAGAVVRLQGRKTNEWVTSPQSAHVSDRIPQHGRYGQFVGEGTHSSTVLRAPGVALRVEYKDSASEPFLNAELKIDASTNTLYPTVVPLIIEISNAVKQVVRDPEEDSKATANKPAQKFLEEDSIITADPSTFLGKIRLNLGVRICRQEFSLSCQPIARVAASAQLDDIYITVNSVRSRDHGHFLAVSAAFEKLQASVQHVYSRESTFSFDVESIVLSVMNSKHVSGTSGVSAILKINPMRTQINARQLQDFLLFREIWIPPEIRRSAAPPTSPAASESQDYLVQRYQQVAAAAAFPWNATVAIAKLSVELELGQAIGRSSLGITNLWASSKKTSDWEQNLCIGVEGIGISSTGRMSGFVELQDFKVRTSITWPAKGVSRQTPLIQASLGFERLRVKAAFDYQAFAIADIASFHFLMYNVHEGKRDAKDRLVAILDGDKIYVFGTATSAAQGFALYQAFDRLVQENQIAYTQSLKDIERFLRRSSVVVPTRFGPEVYQSTKEEKQKDEEIVKAPISLHTDVVVTLRSINVGVFPSTFFDTQIFKLEASDAQARFAVALEGDKVHSGLGLTLGQLRVALASVSHANSPKALGEVTVEDVVDNATTSRGGTILRVPKAVATMQTWQATSSNLIDYIFKSSFEGKVDVGWNYSRISFIRGMWNSHSRTLASRLGKPLPESAVKITTASSQAAGDSEDAAEKDRADTGNGKEREKITAVVNVPQSRYEYRPLEPPVIETPQLRDMGEATPPLEWIGLHRDRLPNVTHQIVIVTLLEVAKEVEDAYSRILGSS